jgi:uncharacterized membrane protein
MKKYTKVVVSFLVGFVCILIALTMQTDNQLIIYFLYVIGAVNIYIGVKDWLNIYRGAR